jgi:hypothetical protein
MSRVATSSSAGNTRAHAPASSCKQQQQPESHHQQLQQQQHSSVTISLLKPPAEPQNTYTAAEHVLSSSPSH